MTPVSRPRWAVVALLALAFATPAAAQDTKRLKVLLVLDTSDPVLAKGVRKDQLNFTNFLRTHIPKDRFEVTELTGGAITAERVQAYYRGLKVDPGDGLVFYYSGHGSIRPGKGHTLEFQKGASPLLRTDLRKAMSDKKASLTVILTDCCSDRLTFEDPKPSKVVARAGDIPLQLTPLARKLFFETPGLVDITAATDDSALADNERGGYFTNAVCRVALRQKDRPAGWKDFHAAVVRETAAIHKDAVELGIAPQLRKGQRFQEPAQMAPLPAGATEAAGTGDRAAAVVSLVNASEKDIEFEYRWAATQPWSKKLLPASSRVPVGTWLPPGMSKTPDLLVRMKGEEQVLTANRFEKGGAPKFADGKVYRFGTAKAAAGVRPRNFELDLTPPPEVSEEPDIESESFPFPPVGSRPLE